MSGDRYLRDHGSKGIGIFFMGVDIMRIISTILAFSVLSFSTEGTQMLTQTKCWYQCGRPSLAKKCGVKDDNNEYSHFKKCQEKCPKLPIPCKKAHDKAVDEDRKAAQEELKKSYDPNKLSPKAQAKAQDFVQTLEKAKKQPTKKIPEPTTPTSPAENPQKSMSAEDSRFIKQYDNLLSGAAFESIKDKHGMPLDKKLFKKTLGDAVLKIEFFDSKIYDLEIHGKKGKYRYAYLAQCNDNTFRNLQWRLGIEPRAKRISNPYILVPAGLLKDMSAPKIRININIPPVYLPSLPNFRKMSLKCGDFEENWAWVAVSVTDKPTITLDDLPDPLGWAQKEKEEFAEKAKTELKEAAAKKVAFKQKIASLIRKYVDSSSSKHTIAVKEKVFEITKARLFDESNGKIEIVQEEGHPTHYRGKFLDEESGNLRTLYYFNDNHTVAFTDSTQFSIKKLNHKGEFFLLMETDSKGTIYIYIDLPNREAYHAGDSANRHTSIDDSMEFIENRVIKSPDAGEILYNIWKLGRLPEDLKAELKNMPHP